MFYGAEAIRATDTPCVYTVHGYHFQRKSTPMRLAGMLAERRAARWADVVVFVCEEDRRLGRSLGLIGPDQRTEVVYNGLDTAGMPDATPPAQACVCFFGRLVVQKDPLLMVEIAAILAREGVRTRFVGGGEMERAVRERAKALGLPIEITGALPRDQALRELAKCSAMVMPSRWEGLPIAISEALAIGVPVIAANVNGVPEIVEDGVDGRLVSSREPEAFASAVRSPEDDSTTVLIVNDAFEPFEAALTGLPSMFRLSVVEGMSPSEILRYETPGLACRSRRSA